MEPKRLQGTGLFRRFGHDASLYKRLKNDWIIRKVYLCICTTYLLFWDERVLEWSPMGVWGLENLSLGRRENTGSAADKYRLTRNTAASDWNEDEAKKLDLDWQNYCGACELFLTWDIWCWCSCSVLTSECDPTGLHLLRCALNHGFVVSRYLLSLVFPVAFIIPLFWRFHKAFRIVSLLVFRAWAIWWV